MLNKSHGLKIILNRVKYIILLLSPSPPSQHPLTLVQHPYTPTRLFPPPSEPQRDSDGPAHQGDGDGEVTGDWRGDAKRERQDRPGEPLVDVEVLHYQQVGNVVRDADGGWVATSGIGRTLLQYCTDYSRSHSQHRTNYDDGNEVMIMFEL